MTERLLEIARELLETPTAPFREQWMCSVLDRIIASIPGAQVSIDRWGNRMVKLSPPHLAEDTPPLVFVAHLDHPGFLPEGIDEATGLVRAKFEGRVFDGFFEGEAVRLFRFAEDSGIRAIIRHCSDRGGPEDNRTILLEPETPVEDAVIGMWDVTPFAVEGDQLHGRACDDLCGVAAILHALEVLARNPERLAVPFAGLFTRAEEAGFCGALALVAGSDGQEVLPIQSDVISVEISSAREGVQPGGGAILRVGDRATAFDQNLLFRLWRAIQEGGQNLEVRRALMDGGTCEATAFAAYGYRAAGVCIPVVNYHNMNQKTGRIATEYVSISDLATLSDMMIKLGGGLEIAPAYLAELRAYTAPLLDRARRRLPEEQGSERLVTRNGGTSRA